MSRTDLDAHTLARSLRRMAGDGSVEWVMEPIQASVLLDIADMLDENVELRETLKRRNRQFETMTDMWATRGVENAKLRELAWTLANCAAGHGCDYCPINGGYGYVGELDMCESVHANMCELGVEAE